ncbi:homoserine O-acetyltransferase/O-succinyltransferase family protein [Methylocystis heyeri]|uniref:Homoserine O-succinyltransferase n=1 Tax=Methylocystis heyeri TaxID=391905 RepID=A0A6B8KHJ4_9HYPH|nr:homoserine O-succinyltransferase [Methylocystis heyeri]QGM47102.1 homoserine O-succinyltransferase [Methylocystis heyeri]
MPVSILPQARGADALEIALVNNMPDQALEATRRQFAQLASAAAAGVPFRLSCYALASVPRSETGRRALAQSYEDIEALYARGADALIVTGTEPRAESLDQEPYWDDFARLVDWALTHTLGALWSCLGAHAAVQRLDGIRRRRLDAKLSGIFKCEILGPDWANEGAAGAIVAPHSRYNGLPLQDLENCGYNISSWSPAVGADNFWRREPSLFLFTQGHPEYDADTLAREFRRDVLRYLTGERRGFPEPPENYFSAAAETQLAELRRKPQGSSRAAFAEKLHAVLAAEPLANHWADDAARLYRNWFADIAQEKRRRFLSAS